VARGEATRLIPSPGLFDAGTATPIRAAHQGLAHGPSIRLGIDQYSPGLWSLRWLTVAGIVLAGWVTGLDTFRYWVAFTVVLILIAYGKPACTPPTCGPPISETPS